MIDTTVDLSPRVYSRIAGVGYLIIIAAGIFAEFVIRSSMIVPGDATTTANNIMASEQLFRVGIAGDLIMLVCDIVVGLALYVLLRPVSKNLALLALLFRLIHTAVYGANLLNLFLVLLFLSGEGFGFDQQSGLVSVFLDAHGIGYSLGLVFFGFHCLLLGYLIYKSGYIPGVLGILIAIAGLGYLIDSFTNVLLSNYTQYESVLIIVVFVPAFIGELSLCLWLLLKGVRVKNVAISDS